MVAIKKLRRIMDKKHNIRNLTFISHRNHGKTTITELLGAAAGIIAQGVDDCARMTGTRSIETECNISVKSEARSLYYEMSDESLESLKDQRDGNEYIINLIDLDGYNDYSPETSAALQITDGSLVIVDYAEGVGVQTETVLRKALSERVRPVLVLNKIDRCFVDLQVDGEYAYQRFCRIIENINAIISTYEDPHFGDVQISAENGTVAFTAGLHGWAFTLEYFAKIYASKFKLDEVKMREKLWGDNFFDTCTRKWTTLHTGSLTCKRGFVQFCYEPVKQIINLCLNGEKEKLWLVLQKLNVTMKPEHKELCGTTLMKQVMQTWLSASSTLLRMMIFHLPSPSTAQAYRVENLYGGPLEDKFATAIRNCDPEGPLMLYVSKMVPKMSNSKFFAFGRVFCGRISAGSKVRIMGPNHVPDQMGVTEVQGISGTSMCIGSDYVAVEDVPCGNVVSLVGLDQFLNKTATLTEEEELDAHPIRTLRFSTIPVVRIAVRCKLASDDPKLVAGLRYLAKSDSMVVCFLGEFGEHIIAGAGELHLELCLHHLIEDFMDRAEIIKSDLLVSFRETVTEKSCRTVMSQSADQHNLLYTEAHPLEEGLAEAIIEGRIGPNDDTKLRADVLHREFGWDKKIGKRIWCFGPGTTGPNIVVGIPKGGKYVNDLKNYVIAEFQSTSERGALAEENMHGICFDICHVILDSDKRRKRNNQVTPMIRHAILESQMTAKPRILEPVYLVEIEVPEAKIVHVSELLFQKNGCITEEVQRPGTLVYTVTGHLPVKDSFGFLKDLRVTTSGQAYLKSIMFDHWRVIPSDPLELGSEAAQLISSIRAHKGLPQLPRFNLLEGQ